MRMILRRKRRANSQAGLSLIELMIAGAVMVVGFMAIMGLVMTSIAANGRNRMDSTGAMLAQAVLEQLNFTLIGPGTTTMTDCSGTVHTIQTAGVATPGAGAALNGADIDFTQAAPPVNYQMDFAVCGVANTVSTYDVRWNIQTLTGTGTSLVTVGVKLKGGGNNPQFFALPVTLRTYVQNRPS